MFYNLFAITITADRLTHRASTSYSNMNRSTILSLSTIYFAVP